MYLNIALSVWIPFTISGLGCFVPDIIIMIILYRYSRSDDIKVYQILSSYQSPWRSQRDCYRPSWDNKLNSLNCWTLSATLSGPALQPVMSGSKKIIMIDLPIQDRTTPYDWFIMILLHPLILIAAHCGKNIDLRFLLNWKPKKTLANILMTF